MAGRTYRVELWDHDPGRGPPRFSGRLAREHLGGPNAGLSWRAVGLALRRLRAAGWSEVSIYVSRED
jgi:hypothetical protein